MNCPYSLQGRCTRLIPSSQVRQPPACWPGAGCQCVQSCVRTPAAGGKGFLDGNGAAHIGAGTAVSILCVCALQWHPEKPPFEFSDLTIPHSHDAISVSQHMANMFVDWARKSAHVPVSKEEELAMLVYNYRAVFTARDIVMEPSYDGCDLFIYTTLRYAAHIMVCPCFYWEVRNGRGSGPSSSRCMSSSCSWSALSPSII